MQESQLCSITCDGKQLVGPAGTPLIEFFARYEINFPHICYERLEGYHSQQNPIAAKKA